MKKKLTKNLSLKILSVFIAFIIWLVILNIDDPTITTRISGIKVTTVNGDSITLAGMYYEVEKGDEVAIVVKGKKSIVDTLTASDFYAEADLSKYSITNAVPIEVQLSRKYASDPEIIEGKSQTMMISVENYLTKQFDVDIQTKGEPAEGYYITADEITASPNRINVSAPESVMKRISSVKLDVYVNDVKKEFRTIVEPRAYDSNGVQIKSDKIKFGVNSISVTATPLRLKEVDIVIETVGEVKEGYELTKQKLSVDKLQIAGTKSVIDKVDKIVLSPQIDQMDKTFELSYTLKEYLPGDVKLVSSDKECKVTLTIEELIEKKLEFYAKDIKFLNLRTDVTADYNTDEKLSLTIRGLAEVINELEIEQFAPHIDMNNLVIGEQRANVNFESIEGAQIVNPVSINIELKDVTTQTEETVSDGVDETPEDEDTEDKKTESEKLEGEGAPVPE